MPKVALVGNFSFFEYHIKTAQEKHPFELFKASNVQRGLELLNKNRFNLIVLRDEMGLGSLPLPNGASRGDYSGFSCYLISQIRKEGNNRETSILVPYVSDCPLTPVKRYIEAGVSECLDLFVSDSIDSFSDTIGKYLKN